MKTRAAVQTGLCAAFVAGLAAPAVAQETQRRSERIARESDAIYRYRLDSSLSPAERSQIDYGGAFGVTGLWLDDSADNSRRLFQTDTILYARASLDGAHTGFARFRATYRDFSPGDSFDGRGDRWSEPWLDRYWYEFDYKKLRESNDGYSPRHNINVRSGRQFVDWGSGLTLSESLYAVRPTYSIGERFFIEGIAGVTPDHIVDFDASRDEYDRRTRRGYYGGTVRFLTDRGREYYVYGLAMEDHNADTIARPDIGTVIGTNYDAQYFGFGTNGSIGQNMTYTGELVYEMGESMSDPLRGAGLAQTKEDISAVAGRAQLTYLLRDSGNSRAQFETIFASGDEDRLSTSDTLGGNLSGTDDNSFNSLGFANTGLAFAPSLSNIWTLRGGLSTFPVRGSGWFDELQVGVDGLLFNKFEPDGGIDEPTDDDMFLGGEVDLFMNWRVTSDFAVTARYGVFFPGAAIEGAGETDTRHYVLIGATLSF